MDFLQVKKEIQNSSEMKVHYLKNKQTKFIHECNFSKHLYHAQKSKTGECQQENFRHRNKKMSTGQISASELQKL